MDWVCSKRGCVLQPRPSEQGPHRRTCCWNSGILKTEQTISGEWRISIFAAGCKLQVAFLGENTGHGAEDPERKDLDRGRGSSFWVTGRVLGLGPCTNDLSLATVFRVLMCGSAFARATSQGRSQRSFCSPSNLSGLMAAQFGEAWQHCKFDFTWSVAIMETLLGCQRCYHVWCLSRFALLTGHRCIVRCLWRSIRLWEWYMLVSVREPHVFFFCRLPLCMMPLCLGAKHTARESTSKIGVQNWVSSIFVGCLLEDKGIFVLHSRF